MSQSKPSALTEAHAWLGAAEAQPECREKDATVALAYAAVAIAEQLVELNQAVASLIARIPEEE